jgi:hypothetical protein
MKRWMTAALAIPALALSLSTARAAHLYEDPSGWWSNIWVIDRTHAPKFTGQELSVDLFGTYMAAQDGIENIFETNIKHGDWGGGVGLNYFLTRSLGLGGDINIGSNAGEFVDQALGSVILRLPIESIGLAPYIFGGGGRGFDPEWEWLADAGVGLELRWNPMLGVFSDARYVWAEKTNDRLMLRAGLRVVF